MDLFKREMQSTRAIEKFLHGRGGRKASLSCCFLAAAFFLIIPASRPAPAQQQAAPAKDAPAAQESKLPKGYVGSETCAGCHEDTVAAFKKNRHNLLESDARRGWQERACESCHGPGEKHAESASAEDIRNPLKLKSADADLNCLSCHRNQPTHIGRIQNSHARNEVACVACHSVHKTGAESTAAQYRQPKGVNKQCASCHTSVWASFQKPHTHRLTEGSMSCVSCHNPHGSIAPNNMKLAMGNEPGCFSCHADKRGPFVHEHAPVRTDSCATCHEPHGSVNPRMLTRNEVANQCLECHSNIASPAPSGVAGGIPSASHDLRLPRWRQCTTCHQKIHGSNVSRGLLR